MTKYIAGVLFAIVLLGEHQVVQQLKHTVVCQMDASYCDVAGGGWYIYNILVVLLTLAMFLLGILFGRNER